MAYAQRETRGADADLCWLQLDAQMTTHTSRIYLYIYSFPIPFPLHTHFAFWPEFRSWRRLLSVDSDSVIDSGFVYGFCVSAFGALTWRQLGSVSQSHSQSPSPDPRPAHKKFAIISLFFFFGVPTVASITHTPCGTAKSVSQKLIIPRRRDW